MDDIKINPPEEALISQKLADLHQEVAREIGGYQDITLEEPAAVLMLCY